MTQENELDINNQKQNKGKLTHFNEAGEAHMVDVHAKDDTYRVAKACGTIKVNGAVYRAVSTGTAKKGDVLAVARIAGIMGAKNNSMLIPLCHAIAMTKCDVEFELDEKNSSITAICTTACVGKTGVEMEAMTATTFLMLILFTLLSCSALSVRLISTFILCYNCCRFHSVISFSFFLRSAQVCIHSLCVLKVKLGIQFTLP